MKLHQPKAELKVVKTLLRGDENVRLHLASRVNEGCFHYGPAREAYTRLANLRVNKMVDPTWEEILHDPVISQAARKRLAAFKAPPLKSKREALALADKLHEYRKLRILAQSAEITVEELRKDGIDPEEVLNKVTNKLTEARTNMSSDTVLTHIGRSKNERVSKIVDKILSGESQNFIPTGFQAFDKESVGLPRKGLVLLGASTSGGKSTVALQMSRNMVKMGFKSAIVSLEMDIEEILARRLANISKISMEKMNSPKLLSPDEKVRVRKKFEKIRNRTYKLGTGFETIMVPDEDVSIEETILLLKPYKYDVIFVDYINLLRDAAGEDQWRQLGNIARYCKRFANANGMLIVLLVQVSELGQIRYSKALKEHANNFWSWVHDSSASEDHIIHVIQQKARQQRKFNFNLKEDFSTMTVRDLTPEELEKYGDGSEDPKHGDGEGGGGGGKHKERRGERDGKKGGGKGGREKHKPRKVDLDEDYFNK